MEVCWRGDGGCSGSSPSVGHRVKRTTRQTDQSKSLEGCTIIVDDEGKDWAIRATFVAKR